MESNFKLFELSYTDNNLNLLNKDKYKRYYNRRV